MPIYEFRCAACGTVFDRLLPMGNDRPLCPSCGAGRSERLVSLVAVASGGTEASGGGCCAGGCGCGSRALN